MAAYTANFGNGFSATVSLEDNRRTPVVNTAGAFTQAGAVSISSTTGATALQITQRQPVHRGRGAGHQPGAHPHPDIVMNWRVDQAWGAAMIGGAITNVDGGYYGNTLTGAQVNGHPTDKIGWVATAGLRLNAPGGSFFQAQASYTEGALRYISHTQFAASSAAKFGVGNSVGLAT